jgi:hypothetical protein
MVTTKNVMKLMRYSTIKKKIEEKQIVMFELSCKNENNFRDCNV